MSEALLEFNDENFEELVLKADLPVLVDFWAEWCLPCRMLTPTIEALAEEFVGRARVGKLNTEESRDIAIKYEITAIPTVLIFVNGEIHQKIVSLREKDEFANALLNALGQSSGVQADLDPPDGVGSDDAEQPDGESAEAVTSDDQ